METKGVNGASRNFFTIKEACDYIGVNRSTFYRFIRKKKDGPPIRRFGPNCIRLPKEKFIKWANAGTGD